MTEWVSTVEFETLKRKRKLCVTVDGADVALFLVEDRVIAMADLCVHKQKRLSKGLIFKGKVICPGHQWAFDVDTGWTDQWHCAQPIYRAMVDDHGMILIDPVPTVHDGEAARAAG
jgi:nitrite reductase/ring-hydroxylating ferredoxin subunit